LHDFLSALPLRDEDQRLRALGIVCDADREDGHTAFGRVRDDLRNTRYAVPARPNDIVRGGWVGGSALSVGVFIMPDNRSPGALEDLCLDSIGTDPSLACVSEFLNCVATTGIVWREQHLSKARLNVWLGSRSDPRRRLRHAIPANVFPIQSPAFGPIRDFLTRLAAAADAPESPSA